ncbi:MAG: hypothetical protein OXE50_02040 [Chloroflexi bacterium]|nr:hypothetical protein [Chloroflexota bacterium]
MPTAAAHEVYNMSSAAQELIAQARDLISREEFAEAVVLLDSVPANQPDWEPHEVDEVTCLAEFLRNLTDEEMSTLRL